MRYKSLNLPRHHWLSSKRLIIWLFALRVTGGDLLSSALAAYSEVTIIPHYTEEGFLEISCFDEQIAEKRLVVTALKLQVSNATHKNGSVKNPYFLGWYIDQKRSEQEMWVGVELPAGSSSGTVALALPALLRSKKTLGDDLFLTICLESPDLGDYFSPTNGTLRYAPVKKVMLQLNDSSLDLKDFVGWEKEGIERLVWQKSDKLVRTLEAKFGASGPFDKMISRGGGFFAGFMFGLFLIGYVFLSWLPRRSIWICLSLAWIILIYYLWTKKLFVSLEILLGLIGFGSGSLVSAIIPKALLNSIKRVSSPSDT